MSSLEHDQLGQVLPGGFLGSRRQRGAQLGDSQHHPPVDHALLVPFLVWHQLPVLQLVHQRSHDVTEPVLGQERQRGAEGEAVGQRPEDRLQHDRPVVGPDVVGKGDELLLDGRRGVVFVVVDGRRRRLLGGRGRLKTLLLRRGGVDGRGDAGRALLDRIGRQVVEVTEDGDEFGEDALGERFKQVLELV